ncbi:MAG TPA: hypothetical protein DCS93_41730 [Microscillaceae bacterium]|nr:hypothetical protein [Microscillaceae bacterium]
MMKYLYAFMTIFLLSFQLLQAQNIPQAPNKTDAQGKRQGKWVILYNNDSKKRAYRVIKYKDDLPQDTVRDYYGSGKVRWKGKLLKDRPKDLIEGKCFWYYENGRVEEIGWYEKGRLVNVEMYYPNGTKLPPLKKGLKYYGDKAYERAYPILEQYKNLIVFEPKMKTKTIYGFIMILATCYQKTGQLVKAKELIPVLKKLKEKLANSWETLNQKGRKLFKAGKYLQAMTILQKAKVQAEIEFGRMHKNFATACDNLAMLYMGQGKFIQATSLCQEAKNIRLKVLGQRHLAYATSCNNLATLLHLQGKYQEAMVLYIEAKNILAKALTINHPDYASACNNLATLYQDQGKYTKAASLYEEAKGIRLKVLGKNHPAYANSCHSLAGLYQVQGKYVEASFLHQKAKKIVAEAFGTNHPLYAVSCNNLATLYNVQGKYTEAISLYQVAKNIYEKVFGSDHPDYASTCNNLADLYQSQGEYSKAVSLYIEAKNIRWKVFGSNHPDYAASCNNLATLYDIQGRYIEATSLYQIAKDIYKKVFGKNHVDYASTCNNLAALYKRRGKYARAKLLYLEAKEVYEKILGKNHPLYAKSCNNLALLYKTKGRYEYATSLYQEAINIQTKVLGNDHPSYAAFCSNLATMYWDQKTYNKAWLLFQKVFTNVNQQIERNLAVASENGRRKFLQTNNIYNYQTYYSFVYAYVDSLDIAQSDFVLKLAYQNRLLIKSLLFNSTQKIRERIQKNGDTSAIKLYEQWIEKRVQYNRALELTKSQRKANNIVLSNLNEEAEELEKQLARKSTTFAKSLEEYKSHTWKEVKKSLNKDEVAIEIIRYNWYNKKWTDTIHYAALIVTPKSKFPYPVFLENGNYLEGKGYKNYYDLNQQKAKDQGSYQHFWQPIQQKIKELYPEAKRVFVSSDGVYQKINLETLWNPATQKYLGEELEIRLVSNTKDLLRRNEPETTTQSGVVGLFGFPDYSLYYKQDTAKLSRLKGSLKEVNRIYQLLKPKFSPQKFLNESASETNIKRLKNPQVLHLATHGFFLEDLKPKKTEQLQWMGQDAYLFVENPLLRSGLYWAGADASRHRKTLPDSVKENGILTAQEVLNMDLDSTQLVVLSACETGRGKIQNGEGVYGLQRAFLSAGAKYVLMSLWKVDDVATQYFMQYFYESWAKSQLSSPDGSGDVRKAYRFAQNKLRQDYPSPYYWGAFVLVSR